MPCGCIHCHLNGPNDASLCQPVPVWLRLARAKLSETMNQDEHHLLSPSNHHLYGHVRDCTTLSHSGHHQQAGLFVTTCTALVGPADPAGVAVETRAHPDSAASDRAFSSAVWFA